MRLRPLAALLATGLLFSASAEAAEIRILSAGAFRSVVDELKPSFEKDTGHKLVIDNGTAGQISERVGKGDFYDVVVTSVRGQNELVEKGKLAKDTRLDLARVGIGIMVRNGMAKPDVSTVDAFKKALLDAKTVAHVDPASGGTTGIYLTSLFEKWGITEQLKPKLKLKWGGHVADLLIAGQADLGMQQISEIVPVKEVTFVGPLPKEIQVYTVYTGALHTETKDAMAAMQLLTALTNETARSIIKSKGMEPGGN